jgi:hypothetical protein
MFAAGQKKYSALAGLAKQGITVHLSFFYGLLMSSPAEDFAVG